MRQKGQLLSNFRPFSVKFYHVLGQFLPFFGQIFGHLIPFPIGMYSKKNEYEIWSTPLGKIPIKSVFGGASLSSQIRAQIWHKISISEGKATIDGRKCSSTILHECKKKNEMVWIEYKPDNMNISTQLCKVFQGILKFLSESGAQTFLFCFVLFK